MQTDEIELITRSISKDADAYGQLVERYKQAIYRHCFALMRDEDNAEDIAQDTFITAYYKLSSFDTSRRFSTWLFKIATNKALNELKRRKKTIPASDIMIEQLVSSHITPDTHAEYRELHAAISRLKAQYQVVVSLYYFEGLDYEQIATMMGKPVGSVKGWMNRAKTQLRKELV